MAFECEAGKILIGLADRVVKDTNRFRSKDEKYLLHCPRSDRNAALPRLLHRGNPVLGFVQERCITEPAARIGKPELYAAYAAYCDEHEVELASAEVFARKLYEAAPGVRKMRGQEGCARTQEYCGIRLVNPCPPEFRASPPEPEPWE